MKRCFPPHPRGEPDAPEVGSLEWLQRALAQREIEGYAILDDEVSFSIYQPIPPRSVEEIAAGIAAVYGRPPRYIVLRGADGTIERTECSVVLVATVAPFRSRSTDGGRS